MIDHRRALTLGATAVDFPLDTADRGILDAHVRECAACRVELAAYHHDAARLAALPPIAPPARVRGVIGKAHRPTRFVLLAAAALLLTASAGLALVGSALRDARTPDVLPAPSTAALTSAEPTLAASIATVAPSPLEAPSELQVACDGTRTDIPTPLVRTQADGVHIHVANTSGRELSFGIEGLFGGETIPAVGETYVYTFGTGNYQLTCGGTASPFAVVDPDGLYTSSELGCDSQTSGTTDYVAGARGPRGLLLDIARMELRDLQPGDVVEHAGYPQAAGGQLVRVVRDGQVVAVLGYADDGNGGWLLSGTRTCSGSNITTASPAADCVNPPPDIAVLSVVADPVACYGNAPLTLDAYPVAGSSDCPVFGEPAWLWCPSGELELVGETRKVGAPFLLVAVDPASGASLSGHFNTNVRVTGHYDDPAAQTCHETGRVAALGTPEPAAVIVERCRRTFVVTQVVPLQP